MQLVNLQLTGEQFNVVRAALGQLPHDQIGGFIQNIEQQAQAQLNAQQQQPAAAIAKAEEAFKTEEEA